MPVSEDSFYGWNNIKLQLIQTTICLFMSIYIQLYVIAGAQAEISQMIFFGLSIQSKQTEQNGFHNQYSST